ncbi:MAG: hypothetical protein WBL66_16345, partial [Candidatus Acidiferrales bacterium]
MKRYRSFFLFLSVLLIFFAAPSRAQERVDLLIVHGTVITMDSARHVYDDGAVAIRGDSIVAVAPSQDLASRYDTARTIDA